MVRQRILVWKTLLTGLALTDLFLITGILDPDPWKRWTAHQASHHPFVAGGPIQRRRDGPRISEEIKDENRANLIGDIYWEPPWDPGICRKKLLNVQKMREKQNAARRGFSGNRNVGHTRPQSVGSNDGLVGDRYVESLPRMCFGALCAHTFGSTEG